MKAAAIIPAAGQGRRMGASINKQYLQLMGKPVLYHTLAAVFRANCFNQVIVVVTPGEEEILRRDVLLPWFEQQKVTVVTGGKERQDSVFNALQSLTDEIDYISVHDGARPLIKPHLFCHSLQEAGKLGAVVTAVSVKDTIKIADDNGKVASTPPRQSLWSVQTPQVFRRAWLEEVYVRARQDLVTGTDDASLLEHYGYPVYILQGDYENFKVTTPEDLLLAEALMGRREG